MKPTYRFIGHVYIRSATAHIPNMEVSLWECSVCGCPVTDYDKHTEFHRMWHQ